MLCVMSVKSKHFFILAGQVLLDFCLVIVKASLKCCISFVVVHLQSFSVAMK